MKLILSDVYYYDVYMMYMEFSNCLNPILLFYLFYQPASHSLKFVIVTYVWSNILKTYVRACACAYLA